MFRFLTQKAAKETPSSRIAALLQGIERWMNRKADERAQLLANLARQLRSATEADGAMIALRARGEQAFRCWASTGDAPPLGSRLRLNRELAERCSAEGFARVEAASSVAVSNDLSGFTSAVIVTFGPKTAGGVVGIFSREATFGPRDLRNIQLTAHKLAPEDGAELDVPVLVPWFDRRDMAKVAAAAVLVLLMGGAFFLPRHATPVTLQANASAREPGLRADAWVTPSLTASEAKVKPVVPAKDENLADDDVTENTKTPTKAGAPESPQTVATNRLPIGNRAIPATNEPTFPHLTSPDETTGTTPRVEVNTTDAGTIDAPENDNATAALTTAALRNAGSPQFEPSQTLDGHSGWVTGVAFSNDGQKLASGSWDHAVKFWDVASGRSTGSITGDVKKVQAMAYSGDGSLVAAEGSDDSVTVWNSQSGREVRTFRGNKPLIGFGKSWVYSIAFSPDGRWLASAIDNKTVRVWDVKTGKVVRDLTGEKRPVIYIAFSQGGRMLATGDDDKTIAVWDVASGTVLSKLKGHSKSVDAVAFSPDGQRLASASSDKTIKIWDFARGREIVTLRGHRERVSSIAFGPDGKWLASGSWDGTVRIWDVKNGRQLEELPAQTKDVYAVAVDAAGHRVAAGGEDGTVRVWKQHDTHTNPDAAGFASAH